MLNKFKANILLFLFLGVLLGYIFVIIYPDFFMKITYCPVKSIYSIPCPACGLSRASVELLRGEWLTAFTINPLVYLVHPLFITLGLTALYDHCFKTNRIRSFINARWSKTVLVLILLLLLLNMVWNIQKGV